VDLKCTITAIEVASGGQIAAFTRQINVDALEQTTIQAPVYQMLPSGCASSYSLLLLLKSGQSQDTLNKIASLNKSGTQISIGTQDSSLAGVYTIAVKATEETSTVSNTEVEFTVTLECTITAIEVVSGGKIDDVTRIIYRDFLEVTTLQTPSYRTLPIDCVSSYSL
jgi:hypothetical protein